jgi:hypothetical protein
MDWRLLCAFYIIRTRQLISLPPNTERIAVKELAVNDAEKALETLVLAYREERNKQTQTAAKPGKFKFELTPFKAITTDLPSRKEIRRSEIIKAPVAGALRVAIREIGEWLWDKTSNLDQMQDMVERIAARHPEKSAYLADAIDSAWDGIGRAGNDPGWCR